MSANLMCWYRESVDKLLEKLEEDDDVTNVYHNIKE